MRIAYLACLLTGCALYTGSDPDSSSGSNSGSGHASPAPTAAGTYYVASTIDVTVEAVLPEPAEDLVVTMRDFSTNPALTLITLADDAGVPAVGELRALLPDALEGELEGWMNDEIRKLKIDGVPVTQLAADAAALAETTLTQFSVASELDIADGQATHRLTAIDFAPAGIDLRIAIASGPADLVSATASASTSHGMLAIGDHVFSLPYGEYVWQAVDAEIAATYGRGIRGSLGAAINCPALAAKIANKCLFGVCAGHASQLTTVCEAGLDEVVALAHDKIAALRFDALHFAKGTAQLVDTTGDGIADELANGTWTAELNVGVGLRPVPATFTAAN